MKATVKLAVLCATILAFLPAACLKYTKPTAAKPQQTTAERNFDALWRGSLEVLRRYNFTVREADRRAGLIVTEPLTGQQWIEFWRKDAATWKDLAESSLDTILRTTKVRIQPVAAGAEAYKVTVEVITERKGVPSINVQSTSGAYSMFITPGELKKATQREEYGLVPEVPIPKRAEKPLPLGKDEILARKIADDINEQAAKILLKM